MHDGSVRKRLSAAGHFNYRLFVRDSGAMDEWFVVVVVVKMPSNVVCAWPCAVNGLWRRGRQRRGYLLASSAAQGRTPQMDISVIFVFRKAD